MTYVKSGMFLTVHNACDTHKPSVVVHGEEVVGWLVGSLAGEEVINLRLCVFIRAYLENNNETKLTVNTILKVKVLSHSVCFPIQLCNFMQDSSTEMMKRISH